MVAMGGTMVDRDVGLVSVVTTVVIRGRVVVLRDVVGRLVVGR
jgi:hypothetical protein